MHRNAFNWARLQIQALEGKRAVTSCSEHDDDSLAHRNKMIASIAFYTTWKQGENEIYGFKRVRIGDGSEEELERIVIELLDTEHSMEISRALALPLR